MAEPQHRSGAPLWGVAAEYDTPQGLLAALRALRDRDFGRLDAFSPVPVAGADEALGLAGQPVRPFALLAFALGAAAMFGLCSYATVWSYRLDVGGRPLFSWPAFLVPSVSFGGLLGAAVAYATFLTSSRLPRLNHPAFNIPDFTRVTEDRFFVAVEARDARFDADAVEAALAALPTRPRAIRRVPR